MPLLANAEDICDVVDVVGAGVVGQLVNHIMIKEPDVRELEKNGEYHADKLFRECSHDGRVDVGSLG